MGWHCSTRDKCVHHKLPTQMHNQFFQPPQTGDACPFYEQRDEPKWGEGKDEDND